MVDGDTWIHFFFHFLTKPLNIAAVADGPYRDEARPSRDPTTTQPRETDIPDFIGAFAAGGYPWSPVYSAGVMLNNLKHPKPLLTQRRRFLTRAISCQFFQKRRAFRIK